MIMILMMTIMAMLTMKATIFSRCRECKERCHEELKDSLASSLIEVKSDNRER